MFPQKKEVTKLLNIKSFYNFGNIFTTIFGSKVSRYVAGNLDMKENGPFCHCQQQIKKQVTSQNVQK